MKPLFTIGSMMTKPEEFIGRKAEVNHLITRLRLMANHRRLVLMTEAAKVAVPF